MKKLTTLLLALAAVSCSSDFTVEAPKGAAIEFENIFVENSTRATALTKENIQDFSVYGFVESGEKQGQIFDNTRIYRAGEQFKYDIEQYWIGGAQYYFTAIAPYQDAKWTYTAKNAAEGTIEFDNSAAAASQDLIFAYVKPEKTPADIESKPDPVSFNFRHLLSRVKFSFTNGFAADSNITLEVSGVKITNTAASGSITVSEGTFGEWTTSGDMTIVFGDAALENQSSLMDAGAAAKSDNYFLIPAARHDARPARRQGVRAQARGHDGVCRRRQGAVVPQALHQRHGRLLEAQQRQALRPRVAVLHHRPGRELADLPGRRDLRQREGGGGEDGPGRARLRARRRAGVRRRARRVLRLHPGVPPPAGADCRGEGGVGRGGDLEGPVPERAQGLQQRPRRAALAPAARGGAGGVARRDHRDPDQALQGAGRRPRGRLTTCRAR